MRVHNPRVALQGKETRSPVCQLMLQGAEVIFVSSIITDFLSWVLDLTLISSVDHTHKDDKKGREEVLGRRVQVGEAEMREKQ